MAIQRPSNDYNSDWMSRMRDGELEELEKRLSALYASAAQEVTDKFNEFSEEFAEQEARMLDLLALGKIDDDDFRIWRNNHILQSVRYQELIKSLTNMMVDTDVSAMAIVSGDLPAVIAQSYNFVQALGWQAADDLGYSVGTFQIYNANAVQVLIRDNPRLVPEVDLPIDQQWNMEHFNKAITQGILTGEPMREIARNLKKVVGMDENSAIRNARTSFTYAENLGRDESFENLKSKGIPVKKRWNAVMDNRTRQTHRLLNGTFADEETGLFGVGILAHPLKCPADKNGDAWEIYNCRCREGVVFSDDIVDHSNDDELYEQFLRENYPDDYEALMDRDYFNQHSTKPLPRPEAAVPAPVVADIPDGARKALDTFEKKYYTRANEYSMVVDDSGHIIGEAGGQRRSTALTQSQNIASEGNYHIHNHPIENIIYSDQDIVNYEKYGVRGGIVITRDGTEYQLINLNPVSKYNALEELKRQSLYGDMTDAEYMKKYAELMPFSSEVTSAFDTIETEWREERRAALNRIYEDLPLPSDSNERRAVIDERNRRYNEWVQSVGSDNDRKIRWLEANASRYGFVFIKRKIK